MKFKKRIFLSLLKDVKEMWKSIIILPVAIVICLYFIKVKLNISIISISPWYTEVMFIIITLFFTFVLFLFQGTNHKLMLECLENEGEREYKKYISTFLTCIRLITMYLLIAVFVFDNTIVVNYFLVVIFLQLCMLIVMYSVLFKISMWVDISFISEDNIDEEAN